MTNAVGKAINLTVVEEPSDDHDRVRIHDNLRTEIGVLTGDRIVVSGEDETITVRAWQPDTLDNIEDGAIPLTEAQRNALGVDVGDEVQVSPGSPRANGNVFDGNQKSTGDDFSSFNAGGSSGTATRSDGGAARTQAGTTAGTNVSSADASESESVSPDVNYDDVGGLDNELDQIREAIELPLNEPETFEDLGINPPKGVLMYGPPGTGKTLIAKAIASEVDAAFLEVNGPEIMSKYKGESEQKLRDVFNEARQKGDAIIFFDEIDSFAGQRDDGDDADNRVVAQLLSLMDGMESRENVVVIGATNRVDSLDPALRRGGRFDREVEIGVPDEKGREEIFEIHAGGMPLGDDVSVSGLAERTHGFVGADIAAVCREAAMEALRRCKTDDGEFDTDGDKEVCQDDFDKALSGVEPSAMREFVAEDPDLSFEKVGGLDDAKTALKRNIEWPLKYNDLFDKTGTDPSPGVLLHGESGTGKTMLARALAGESDVNFIHVNSPELIDKYVGESEKAVREVFQRARQAAPSIIFLDDIDAVASTGMDSHEVTERIVSQINTELDAVREDPNVTALAATQDPDMIDQNLVGTGRFEELIELQAPDQDDRIDILEIHAADKPLGDEVDFEEMAEKMEGATGADIEAVVREASMTAIEETVDEDGIEAANEGADDIEVTKFHFETAMQNLGLRDK